jgi:alanine-alpha-ketoisovalerate/valine-pyruvate aminotransferase
MIQLVYCPSEGCGAIVAFEEVVTIISVMDTLVELLSNDGYLFAITKEQLRANYTFIVGGDAM